MTPEWSIRPRWESARYRPSPSRREAIYGRIRPMDVADTHPLAKLALIAFAIVGVAIWIPWRTML